MERDTRSLIAAADGDGWVTGSNLKAVKPHSYSCPRGESVPCTQCFAFVSSQPLEGVKHTDTPAAESLAPGKAKTQATGACSSSRTQASLPPAVCGVATVRGLKVHGSLLCSFLGMPRLCSPVPGVCQAHNQPSLCSSSLGQQSSPMEAAGNHHNLEQPLWANNNNSTSQAVTSSQSCPRSLWVPLWPVIPT